MRKFRFFIESFIPPLITVITAISLTTILFSGKAVEKRVDKTRLLADMEIAINSGADLQDIKQIFENRQYIRRNILRDIKELVPKYEVETNVYNEPLALSTVLKDLKANIFLRKEVNKNLASKIKEILAEHEKINPFDKLESGQRIHFETIQSKLGVNYSNIQQDVNLIVDEISTKNKLVTKYLRDATLSFRISIIALVVGLLAFIPQLVAAWRWWKQKVRQI